MKKNKLIIHPYLLAVFPILFIFQHNIQEVVISRIILPMVVSLLGAALLFLILTAFLKDKTGAGLITSFFLFMFFSYGAFYDFLTGNVKYVLLEFLVPLLLIVVLAVLIYVYLKLDGKKKKQLIAVGLPVVVVLALLAVFVVPFGTFFEFMVRNQAVLVFFTFLQSHNFLMVLWVVVFLVVSYFINRARKKYDIVSMYLNTFSIVLVGLLLLQIGFYGVRSVGYTASTDTEFAVTAEDSDNPDIYYIILDEYGRADKLEEHYQYDNTDFIEMLKSKGFFIASKSRSNYASTRVSLPSSLNMEQVTYLVEQPGAYPRERGILRELVLNSRVANFLKARGYTIIHFSSGEGINLDNKYADIEYSYNPLRLNEFNRLLIESSWLRAILSSVVSRNAAGVILFNFEKLGEVPENEAATFVFAHFILPHTPYIFDAEGNIIPQEKYRISDRDAELREKRAYIDQLIFTNKKVEELVTVLLNSSETQPIIIIQSDHGTASSGDVNQPTVDLVNERQAILNAYYFPRGIRTGLYDSISPVNSFRLVFNLFFNASFELLEDESYYSSSDHIFNFVLLPDESEINENNTEFLSRLYEQFPPED